MAQLISIPGIGRTALINEDGFYAVYDSQRKPTTTSLEWFQKDQIVLLTGEGCIIFLGNKDVGINSKRVLKKGFDWVIFSWALLACASVAFLWLSVYLKVR